MTRTKPQERLAQEHISQLSKEYDKARYANKALANRYLQLIRRIAMKFRLRLPREVKHSYCKHCKQAFIPGKNCRVRTRDGKLVYYCYSCKKYTRLPLSLKR